MGALNIKKMPKWFWPVSLGAALLAAGGWYFNRPQPVAVALAKAEKGTVEATVSNTRAGSVKACRRAKLAPAVGGQIAEMKVRKGERVAKGQALIELWSEDLRAQERLSHQQLTSAQARVDEVCTLAETARHDAERSEGLREKGFISAQQLERSRNEAKARQASCEATRNDIKQAQSRIDLARAGLKRMVLRAPFDGIVADISGEEGEFATPSPPGIPTLPAIDLIDDSCLYVSAPIDEVDAASVKIGQVTRITLDAVKTQHFPGKVKRIAPYVLELEKQARTVEVEVSFDTPPESGQLLVGYSADVEIVHTARKSVLRVPSQALLEGKRVLVYRAQDGMLEERIVSTGLSNWEYTEVVSGLKEGEQVVLSLDRAGVKAGVKARPESGAAAK